MEKRDRKSIAEKRRTEILEAFYRCVRKYGLHRASNRKLAEEADIQLSSLHHYFKNRDEMIEELVKRVIEEDVVRGRAYVKQKKRLDSIIKYIFDPTVLVGRHKGVFYDFWSEAFRNEKIRETLAREIRFRREEAMKYLREAGIARGMSLAETKQVANIVLALHEGAEYLWTMDPENVSLKRITELTKGFIQSCGTREGKRKKEP